LDVKRVPIESLSEDPANARKHSKWNIDAVKASYRAFGQQKPLVVDQRGIIIAGNAQWRAARELGWKEIDVVMTTLTGSEAVAFAITDNRTAELGEWDLDALSPQLEQLQIEEFDLEALGWSEGALDALLKGLDDGPKEAAPKKSAAERGTSLKLSADQWQEIQEAVRLVMEETGSEMDVGSALVYIVQQFMHDHSEALAQ
jgi:ParB-like chromosome segregation protein Spo0J